jgi:hypothetical protein
MSRLVSMVSPPILQASSLRLGGKERSYFLDGQGAPQGAQAPAKSSGETARPLDGLLKCCVPPDLEAKLNLLAIGDLAHRFIARHCRTIIALLQATETGSFGDVSPAELERLLRLVAYVRKDDDAIPDYRPGGFLDDQQELRATTIELNPLLQRFKAWRLCHQVPEMWRTGQQTTSGHQRKHWCD